MTVHPATINSLRYLKRSRLESEQQLQRNYYRELIHSYGVDTSYFRHDATPFEEPSAYNYDYTYGEKSTMSYWLSASVVVFMETQGDAAILNKFGIETDGDMDAYVLIDDFTEQFRDQIGTVESQTISFSVSSDLSGGAGTLSGYYADSDIELYISEVISGETSGVVSGAISSTPIRTPKKHHDLIYRSATYDSRRIDGTLVGSWSGTLDLSGDGIISGTVSGEVTYIGNDPQKWGGPNWQIAPQVGDFFRLDFNEDDHEEYEITRLIDRNLQTDGINALLSKYVWHMSCVRRDPSHENVIGDIQQEEQTASKIESNFRFETESNEVFDYTVSAPNAFDGVDSDGVYGTYGI